MIQEHTNTSDLKNVIDMAYEFSRIHHGDQKDDCGKNYFITHVCQVVKILSQVTSEESILAAGYLHDTIEDCGQTHQSLKFIFGKKIADLVMEVTHDGTKQNGFIFPRLNSKEAILIKFADRLSNLSRMESWDKERQEHYLKRSKFWRDKY